MTTTEVSYKTVAMQNNSQWPCSMCPSPQFRLVVVRTFYIFLIFPEHHEFWTPLQISIWGSPWLHSVTILLQLSQFFLLSTHLPITSCSPRQSPHHFSCPWVMIIGYLTTPFSRLHFTSHSHSVITYLYFLIRSPLHPLPPKPSPI